VITIDDTKTVTLTDLPFEPGREVEIGVTFSKREREKLVAEFSELFRSTQATAAAHGITEEDIQAEIDAYRRGE
jgi:phosphoribosyl-ATP pyrophosphohydrolase